MSKLTLHTQLLPGWLPSFLEVSGAGYIKSVDAFYDPVSDRVYRNARGYDARDVYHYPEVANAKVIARTFMLDSESNALIWQGAAGADSWFARWQPTYEANPHVWAWEGPNEPQPMGDPSFRVQLDEFTSRLADLMHDAGLRLVGHNFGVGWPDVGHGPDLTASITKLHAYGFYLGVHEYSAPTMQEGERFYCLRYRSLVAELQSAGVPIPQIVIGECGLDGGVLSPPPPYVGWKTLCNQDASCYIEQLIWYESELRKDDAVVCATIFTAGAYDPWWDFEMEEDISMLLAEELQNLPEQPSRAKGFLLRSQEAAIGRGVLEAAWEAGFRFVEIRASVGVTPEPTFQQWWDDCGQIGFLRGVAHWVHPEQNGQATAFRAAVGDRIPELGIYASLGGTVTLDKAEAFLAAADSEFGQVCHVRCRPNWLNALGTPDWQAEGRKLSVVNTTGANLPTLPNCYDDWEFWVHAREQVAPFPISAYLVRYNGTDAELYAEYGGGVQQVIAELLLAQAKNAEVAAHIANALAMLQGRQ